MTHQAAVLTGDLVKSTRFSTDAVDAAMTALSDGAAVLSRWSGSATRFTRFRGDGWQIYLEHPGLALRSCLYLTACLRAQTDLGTRIAVGIGAVAAPPPARLDSASGAAFELSGRALDGMRRGARLILSAPALPRHAAALFPLADAIARGWTAKQAQAMMLALSPDAPSQADMAAQLGIAQQSLADRIEGAALWALEPALSAFEDQQDA